MKQSEIVSKFKAPPHPKGITIEGDLVVLKPLVASQFAKELYMSNSIDNKGLNWAYLPYGPFESLEDYAEWIESLEGGDDPVFFAILFFSPANGQDGMVCLFPATQPVDVKIGLVSIFETIHATTVIEKI